MQNTYFNILQQTILITSFVMVMMMVIEYATVLTNGKWSIPIKKSKWLQVIFAALLGIIPGCLGTFTAVSLYSHKIINFAALVTVMIATSGDEAFIMFSMIPKTALIISLSIFVIAILTGFIINLFNKNKTLMVLSENHLNFKHDNNCVCFDKNTIIRQLFNFSSLRFFFSIGGLLFLFLLGFGIKGPYEWDWEKSIYFIASFIGFLIVITVPDHFLEEHIWKHVIKRHLLKIFLWIFGALIFIHFLENFLDIEAWIKNNYFLILIIAVLIGIIPESGPHIVFISLFISHTIPFSILLVNSIVQDGHGAIPLLAESRKSFFAMKGVNIIVALIVGIVLNLFKL
ncbi:MAG: hypothetical protein GXO79_07585 [Chlorobi bacterium]|nr:hypothetical protein [Chlorobiota bacterium]